MTPTQFVDRLNTDAGSVLSTSERATADYTGFDFWLTKLKKAAQKFFRKLLKGLRYIPRVLQTS
jgi:hypothetical protein